MAHSSSDNLSLLEHERRYRYYIAPTDDKAEGDTKAPVNLATTELHNAVIHHIRGQCGRDFIFFLRSPEQIPIQTGTSQPVDL